MLNKQVIEGQMYIFDYASFVPYLLLLTKQVNKITKQAQLSGKKMLYVCIKKY